MATGSRVLWKGAITFGLVHIPVALHTATSESGLNFDWLDKRSMDPVGYKRINKKTGKEITSENIVKGSTWCLPPSRLLQPIRAPRRPSRSRPL
jgi:DNA end-binding protein Ku